MNGVKEMSLLDAKQSEALAPVADSGVSIFERLARDQSMDVDKLERLMQMYERTKAREAESAWNAAMAEAQTEMRAVVPDAYNPQTKSKYASYAALDAALRPIYTKHGFAPTFNTGEALQPDYVRVLCSVAHRGGHKEPYRIDMPVDGKGAKGGDVMTKTHATGSGVSYGMRYLLKMIFNVAVGEVDDDGNGAGATRPKPPEGFQKYWDQLSAAADKGQAALQAVWACSQDEPYKSYRAYLTLYGKSEIDALRAVAKQVGK